MATIDAPFGFRPIGSLSGAPYVGTLMECAIPGGDGTNTFVGDFVKLDGESTVTGTLGSLKTGIPTVIQVTAGDAILGAITGFAPIATDLGDTFALGANANDRICYVAVADPMTLFLGQEDGLTDALDKSDVGSVCDIVVGTGDTTYGLSAMEINSDSAATSGSKQVRIISLYQDPDNVINTGTTPGSLWIVQVTEPQLGASATSAGL